LRRTVGEGDLNRKIEVLGNVPSLRNTLWILWGLEL